MPQPCMTLEEAERLADAVRSVHPHCVTVKPDGDCFLVQVVDPAEGGIWTLYDEEDWSSYRSSIIGE